MAASHLVSDGPQVCPNPDREGSEQPRKVFVAGATGNLGRRIAKALCKNASLRVVCATRGLDHPCNEQLLGAGAELVVCDLLDAASLVGVCEQVDVIVSCVRSFEPRESFKMQQCLLAEAEKSSVATFFASDFVPGYTESLPCIERLALFGEKADFRRLLHSSAVCGAHVFCGQLMHSGDLQWLFGLGNKELRYWGPSSANVALSHPEDVAECVARAVADGQAGDIYTPCDVLSLDALMLVLQRAGHVKACSMGSLEDLDAAADASVGPEHVRLSVLRCILERALLPRFTAPSDGGRRFEDWFAEDSANELRACFAG